MPAKKRERLTLREITFQLAHIDLGRAGGRAREVEFFESEHESYIQWRITPEYRKRLDHYGNGGEGWSEAWYPDYADPIQAASQTWLDRTFGPGQFIAKVGEKGHVTIEPTRAGLARISN